MLFQVHAATEQTARSAVDAAEQAVADGKWAREAPEVRSRLLFKLADSMELQVNRLAEMESLQTGRPIREMKAQLARLPEWMRYFGSLCRTAEGSVPPFQGEYLNYVKRVPLGIVAQITPWNHPLLIAVKKMSVALATGNAIVVKPSELAPASVVELAIMAEEAGIPPGVVNVVLGVGPEAGKALVQDARIAKIDLTGGTTTGRLVGQVAGKNLTQMTAELGGKSPVLVFKDADIDQAVNGAAFAAFIAAGQTCIMGSRVLVQEDVIEEFIEKFVAKAKGIRMGDPMDLSTQMGPVISEPQLARIRDFVSLAEQEGAEILCGGNSDSSFRDALPEDCKMGLFYPPTIIRVKPKMKIVDQEVFGPVVVVYSFKDEEDAIQKANDSEYGLAAAIWTSSISRAHQVANRLDAGIIWINDHHRNDPSSPWGGLKNSGFGRENGWDAYREYSQSKSVVVNIGDAKFDWFNTQAENVRYS